MVTEPDMTAPGDPAARIRRLLEQAMLANPPRTVEFDYVDAQGRSSRREVEPYTGTDEKLTAFDRTREAIRIFVLASMTNVQLGEPFVPREGYRIEVKFLR